MLKKHKNTYDFVYFYKCNIKIQNKHTTTNIIKNNM